jgi:Na+-transporting NADH:ubiquinone oxidoreductase subunit NqrC
LVLIFEAIFMINRRNFIIGVPIALTAASMSSPANATVYFTEAAVRKVMFPSATQFIDRSVKLTAAQIKAIKKAASAFVLKDKVLVWDVMGASGKLGTLFIDQVYGKHEFITYALALGPDDEVTRIEVMDYRETYGEQVRNPNWRAQFTGKRHGQPIFLNKQIKNISGATLSCIHLTEGVRRLLATKALILTA